MRWWLGPWPGAAVFVALVAAGAARADDADAAAVPLAGSLIGQQQTLVLTVRTATGATVEVDPAAPGWDGVEVVRVESATFVDDASGRLHKLRVVVAPFVPGELRFQPTVVIVSGAEATARTLPEALITVSSSLPPGAPLELTPTRPPAPIGGARSPFLWPAIGLGLAIIAGGATLAVGLVLRWWTRRPRALAVPEAAPVAAGLTGYEGLMETDPVRAYRRLSAEVRVILAQRYGFPATALTTRELPRRLEEHGADRWQARLAAGLLAECDAVVYAGYLPAPERRLADLTTAREIAEASG